MSYAGRTSAHQRNETGEAWDRIAHGYDAFVTPTHLWLAGEGLRRAGVGQGMHMLDVAAGSGALAVPALRLGARVLAVDISAEMIEQLQRRARREGLSGLEGRVMDGHALDLPDDMFDIAGSQFGVMLFPDLPRGLREMVRVTRPGGRVLVVAYGPAGEVEFIQFFMRAVRAVVPNFEGLPSDPPPLPFQVADPRKLQREMERAGLKDVRVETVTEKLEFPSGQHLWDWLMNSNPIPGMLVANLAEHEKKRVRDALEREVRERAGRSPAAALTNPVHIAVGRK